MNDVAIGCLRTLKDYCIDHIDSLKNRGLPDTDSLIHAYNDMIDQINILLRCE